MYANSVNPDEMAHDVYHSGPSCSKLMMLLVNVSLTMAYFAEKKMRVCKSYSHFFSKNTCEVDIILTRELTF